MEMLILIFVVFVLAVFSGLAILDLNGFRTANQEMHKTRSNYRPKTLVIVPCKGRDLTLKKNLLSLKNQDYSDYDIVAVVADDSDEAVPYIKAAGIRYITATSECTRCSAKVRSLATAFERFKGYDAYVTVDSDMVFGRLWLSTIIAPLADKRVGLSTMYPRFIPKGGFWSETKQVWNFVGENMMNHRLTRFGCGGSNAFRRDLLDSRSMRFFKNSAYSLSDDICLTKIARGKGLGIAYSRSPQPVTYCRESFWSFFEWANRQTAFVYMGYPNSINIGIVFYSAEILVFASGVALSVLISPAFIVLLSHSALAAWRNHRRAKGRAVDILAISLLTPFLYLSNLLIARGMKTVTWRGITYRLRN